MKKCIEAANFTKYNANNRGNSVGDCVKRGISMAFDMDYNAVAKLLLAQAKKVRSESWKVRSVFGPVIESLGGKHVTATQVGDPVKVDEFIDAHADGTYILLTGPKPTGKTDHLTCCVDGTLFDSWDSSQQFVFDYYIVEGAVHNFTDIKDYMPDLFEMGWQVMEELCYKYQQKYDLQGDIATYRKYSGVRDFKLVYYLEYADDPELNNEEYSLTISCIFTPTMTHEQAEKKMKETVKIRMYDFFYGVNKKREGAREGAHILSRGNYSKEDLELVKNNSKWLYGREKSFYNSLPGWIKPLVIRINIQEPGQFTDSYSIRILPLPNDPNRDRVEFEGYDAAMVKDMMKRYKENLERPYEDYDPYQEY